jgi:hypothetical protein
MREIQALAQHPATSGQGGADNKVSQKAVNCRVSYMLPRPPAGGGVELVNNICSDTTEKGIKKKDKENGVEKGQMCAEGAKS